MRGLGDGGPAKASTVGVVAPPPLEPLVELLTDRGFKVVFHAETASDGLAAAMEHLPDFTVVCLHLPDGSGLDLCRALSMAAPSTRVVIHAPRLTEDLEVEAVAAGAVDVVEMTIWCEELVRALS
jgi:two-component system response regulator DevR